MKKILLMLAILFICGIIAADICIRGLQNENILINMEIFEIYAYSNVAFKDVIWNMLYERGKLIICLLILCVTPLKNHMPVIFISIFSFCFGFFTMSCIEGLGFVGICVALASVIPQGLLYVGIFVMMYQNQQTRGYRLNDKLPQRIATYLFMLLLFVTGCVMECVMGVHFIPWIIRLSLI